MPLSNIQKRVLGILAQNRQPDSHLAGASAIHASADSLRYSGDLDLFHDDFEGVAQFFAQDLKRLKEDGMEVHVRLSQPGFIRASVTDGSDAVLIDWAQDSVWRFMPPVQVEEIGYVLHPVDLAINKVLALAGREEPRDWIDILYLDRYLISLGALIWAAVGKDAGLNPTMLLDLLSRKGRVSQKEISRLDMRVSVDLASLHEQWRNSLQAARIFVESQPPEEAGHLYIHPPSGLFFTPNKGDSYHLHPASQGGVLPRTVAEGENLLKDSPDFLIQLEHFFGRKILYTDQA